MHANWHLGWPLAAGLRWSKMHERMNAAGLCSTHLLGPLLQLLDLAAHIDTVLLRHLAHLHGRG